MAGTPAPATIYRSLLQRNCDILSAITWTNAEGGTERIGSALPRRFAPIVGPYPLVLVFVSGVHYERGSKFTDHIVSVTLQVWGGPVAAGYVGENEDKLNMLYGALAYEIDHRPYLDSPTDGTPLDYLKAEQAVQLVDNPAGTTGFEVVEGANTTTRYFGTEFLELVHLRLPRQRLS